MLLQENCLLRLSNWAAELPGSPLGYPGVVGSDAGPGRRGVGNTDGAATQAPAEGGAVPEKHQDLSVRFRACKNTHWCLLMQILHIR